MGSVAELEACIAGRLRKPATSDEGRAAIKVCLSFLAVHVDGMFGKNRFRVFFELTFRRQCR